MTHSDSKRPQASQPLCSRRDHKYLRHCVPGRDIPQPRTQIKILAQDAGQRTQIQKSLDERMLEKLPECIFYLINLFPEFQIPHLLFLSLEFQIPYLHFFLIIKMAGLKGNVRWSVRVLNPSSSQLAGHLNKAPIKTDHCLCLLVLVVRGSINADFSNFKCAKMAMCSLS